jgi:hypothetical protein|tara:strand:+ start:1721 stop:2104 length:384 start_codon:yes stop_codon:yes gene_type:complete
MRKFLKYLKKLKMKKSTIGKIQFSIGLILLIWSIIGGIVDYQITNNRLNEYEEELNSNLIYLAEEFNNQTNKYSNETKLIIWETEFEIYSDLKTFTITNSINIGLALFLTLIISILLITQGLVNIEK